MKKKIVIPSVCILAVLLIVRISVVNISAKKVNTEIYDMNTWVDLSGDFMYSAEEKSEGYSVLIENVQVYTNEEYLAKHDKPYDYLADQNRFDVMEIQLRVKNTDNENGYIFVKQYNLFNENKDLCYYYDNDLLNFSEPRLRGNFSFAIQPNTEYVLALPYSLSGIKAGESYKDAPYYLMVSAYPTKKLIRILL